MRQIKMTELRALRDRTTNPQQRAQWDAIISELAPRQPVQPERARSRRSAVPNQSGADTSLIEPVSRQTTFATTFASILFLALVVMALIWIPRIVYYLLDGLLSALTMS